MPNTLSEMKLLPCGHSIGVNLLKKDLMVMDLRPVMKPNGLYYYPAHEWDIRVHDVLLEVESQPLICESDLCRLINQTMQKKAYVEVTLRRHNQVLVKNIRPYYCTRTQSFRLGIRVKVFDVGIGTLTFYDPVSQRFCAFGHFVPNLPDENHLANTLFPSTISSIIKGRENGPGKKLGYLNHFDDYTGKIEQNNEMGLFGTLNGQIESPFFKNPLPVGLKTETHVERASFYTVVAGNQIEKFEILITEVLHKETANRDLRLLIDDDDLLLKTGGVIMGMSGSPIVQNGIIIGAISYLASSNSASGFGVSMENMLREGGWV